MDYVGFFWCQSSSFVPLSGIVSAACVWIWAKTKKKELMIYFCNKSAASEYTMKPLGCSSDDLGVTLEWGWIFMSSIMSCLILVMNINHFHAMFFNFTSNNLFTSVKKRLITSTVIQCYCTIKHGGGVNTFLLAVSANSFHLDNYSLYKSSSNILIHGKKRKTEVSSTWCTALTFLT